MKPLSRKRKKKPQSTEVLHIDLACVFPRKDQPRRYFDPEALSRLADSIVRFGVIQPIAVRELEEGYEIIAGERRFRAAKMAGLDKIPAIVYPRGGWESDFVSVVENLLREDLNMFESAVAMDRLCRVHGLTQEEVASRLCISQSCVANKLRLLRLDEETREKILAAGLSERHARALLRLPPTLWQTAIDRSVSRKLNAAAAERMVEDLLKEKDVPKKRIPPRARGVLRDLRLFYNSVDKAVETARRCGVGVDAKREERKDATLLIIRIPKTAE